MSCVIHSKVVESQQPHPNSDAWVLQPESLLKPLWGAESVKNEENLDSGKKNKTEIIFYDKYIHTLGQKKSHFKINDHK